MRNYTPLFSQIVDSSLWSEALHVRVLFVTMLASQDWDHVVRVQDHQLPGKANLEDDQVLDALQVLSSPDRRSKIPQPFDGRRIEKVDDGWLILNGEKYQEWMRQANLQAKWRRQKNEKRLKDAVKKIKREMQDKADYMKRDSIPGDAAGPSTPGPCD